MHSCVCPVYCALRLSCLQYGELKGACKEAEVTVPGFAWKRQGKARKPSVLRRVAGSRIAAPTPVVPKLFGSAAPLVLYTNPQRPPTFFKNVNALFFPLLFYI